MHQMKERGPEDGAGNILKLSPGNDAGATHHQPINTLNTQNRDRKTFIYMKTLDRSDG